MISVTSEELGRILTMLDEALQLHDQWRENLIRSTICHLPLPPSDLAADAHRHCGFGKWFYSKSNEHIRNLATFRKIAELHQEVHQSARQVFISTKGVGFVPEADYDHFLGSISRFRDELMAQKQRVSYTLQNIDPLTGAFNHAKLLPDLRAEQERLKTHGAPYTLLLINIDLKTFNQNHGRSKGDDVLRTTIGSVREALSPGDYVYRYGGAEFVISLPGRNAKDAEQIKEQLLKKIGESLLVATGEPAASLQIYYSIVELDANTYVEELLDRSARSTYTIPI